MARIVCTQFIRSIEQPMEDARSYLKTLPLADYACSLRAFWDLPVRFRASAFGRSADSTNPFEASSRIVPLPNIRIGRFSGSAHSAEHPFKNGCGDDIAVNFLLSGRGRIEEGSAFSFLEPNDFVLTSSVKGARWSFSNRFDEYVLRIPSDKVAALEPVLGLISGRRLHAGVHLQFLRNLLDGLMKVDGSLDAASSAQVESTVLTLLTAAVGETTGGIMHRARMSSQMLLAQVKNDIAAHIADPGLSPQMLAERHGVSLRKLHALFEEGGTSVMQYVQEERLARAKSMLEAPPGEMPVSCAQVAFACGFKSQAHFSRLFKRRFGCTPTESARKVSGH
jgi:AraC-like DNA-binding protein